MFGWTVRDMKGNKVKRFKVKRRKYRVVLYQFNGQKIRKVRI
jgi:hypothetical protein